ncbi:MAG: hypothetical protein IPG76_01125 [Acidobacteria bacterium]|nr:hypothetical protein [Acidobacteriota bacterium]
MILQRLITIFLLIAIGAAPAAAAVFQLIPDESQMAEMACCSSSSDEGTDCSSMIMMMKDLPSQECSEICICEIKDQPDNPGLLTTNQYLPNPQPSSQALTPTTDRQRPAGSNRIFGSSFAFNTGKTGVNPGCLRI